MRTTRKSSASTTNILNFLTSSKKIISRNADKKTEVQNQTLEPSLKKQKTTPKVLSKSVSQPTLKLFAKKAQDSRDKGSSTLGRATKSTAVVKNIEQDKENSSPRVSVFEKAKIALLVEQKEEGALKKANNKQATSRKRQLESSSDVENSSSQKAPPLLISNAPIEFKAGTVQEPAFRKFAPLLQARSKYSLPLPPAYQKLITLFVGIETVLNYMKSRNSTPIFHKLIKSIEQQARSSFSADLFAQIVTIYPEGFKLASIPVMINDEKVQSFTVEFPTDPIAEQFLANLDRTAQGVTHGPRASKKTDILEDKYTMMDAIKKLTDQTLIRRLEFQKRLEDRVRDVHNKFLAEKGLEWTLSPTQPTWHPEFDLGSVPTIEKAVLPIKKAVPYLEALKRKSASFVTTVARDPFIDPPAILTTSEDRIAALAVDKNGNPISRAQALLERVREKQRQKAAIAAANPQNSPEMIKRRSMLSRIRSIASSLSLHLRTNGKSVMAVPEAIAQLQLSFPNYYLNPAQWYEHLNMLVEIAPAFCTKEVQVSCSHLKTLQPQHYLLRFHQNARIKTVSDAIEKASQKSS